MTTTLINDEGKWVAAALYLPVSDAPFNLIDACKRKQFFLLLQIIFTQPLKYTIRGLQFTALEEKHWYKEPFVNLDMLGSLEKGCGAALINATIKNYDGQNIALNSSVGKNDHTYYTQFGFEPYYELIYRNNKTVMMVRKAEKV